MSDVENLVKGIQRFDLEWGKSMTVLSHICVECLEEKEERGAVAMQFPFEYEGVDYKYINLPLCRDCPGNKHIIYENVLNYIDGEHIEALIL